MARTAPWKRKALDVLFAAFTGLGVMISVIDAGVTRDWDLFASFVPVMLMGAWQAVLVARGPRRTARKTHKVAVNLTAIVTTWSLVILAFAFTASAPQGIASFLFAAGQITMMYRLDTANVQRYKVLSSFSAATINLVACINLFALLLGFVQSVIDAAQTEVKYRLWAGPLGSVFSSLAGAVPTLLLVWSIRTQRHGLLKFSRHLTAVTTGFTVASTVLTPAFVLAVFSQCALLAVSRNMSRAGGGGSSPRHGSGFGGDQRPFAENIRRDPPHFFVLCAASFGLFFRVLPYAPDYDGRKYGSCDATGDVDIGGVPVINFVTIGISWLFEVLALTLVAIAIGHQRRDVLMVARSFVTVAASVSPLGTAFEIVSATRDHTLPPAAVVFRSMGAIVLSMCSVSLIWTTRSSFVPPSAADSGVIGGRGDEATRYVDGSLATGLIGDGGSEGEQEEKDGMRGKGRDPSAGPGSMHESLVMSAVAPAMDGDAVVEHSTSDED